MKAPLKPFSVTSYVLLATLWAFLLPGLLFTGFPIAAVWLAASVAYTHWSAVLAIGVLVFCVFLSYRGLQFQKRLSESLRAGQVPGSFALWILPFWIPLFWGLVFTAVRFFAAPILFPDYASYFGHVVCYVLSIFLTSPQYLFLHVFVAYLSDGDYETVAAIFNGVTLLFAIGGTVYISHIVSPVSKTHGLALCAATTFFLCGLVGLAHSHFRASILPPFFGNEAVQDDVYNYRDGSFDNIVEYNPWRENNKLINIESPTLVIDSDHPRMIANRALYPLCTAAIGAPSFGITSSSIKALCRRANRCDMSFTFRPSDRLLLQTTDAEVELVITPIGYEAFVFFVNENNPVDNLSLDQIRDIYSKRVTRWNRVGGKNERITAFQRDEGSGSQDMFISIMGNVPIAPPLREEFRRPPFIIPATPYAVIAEYRNYNNAIGFSYRYYVETLHTHDGIKLLNINGIAPTIENIQNGTYPLIGELVIISRADNTNPNVPKLTEWFLSPQGQQLVRDVGYVPLE